MQIFFWEVFPIIRKKVKIIKEHLLFCCGFVNFAHQLIKQKRDMKRLITAVLFAASLGSNAHLFASNECNVVSPDSVDKETIFINPEVQPQFPGGVEALKKYLETNLKYPPSAQKAKVEGRVLVQFLIDKEGNVCDPVCVKSVHKDLDAEAIRVVKSMPKWQPYSVNGVPKDMKYTIPVAFRLNIDEAKKPGGQMPPRMGGNMGGRMGGPRTTAVFGVYKKGKNRGGFDEYMLGVKDKLHQAVKLTVNYNVKTKNEELNKEIAQRVFGVRDDFETALKAFHKSLDEIKIEEAKITVIENETEYQVCPNGVVGIEYRSLAGATNLQKLPAVEYMLFDTNNNKVVTLADLITPALGDYLKEKGVDIEKSTNISIKGKGFIAVTSLSAITMDGEKLKDKLSDYALEILGMER